LPLNQDPLPLSQSPRAAADARRWIADVCRQLERDDLVECAEMGTGELVANAILHGEAPIAVRMRGTSTHPRVEVLDGSSKAPVPPSQAADPEDFLATFGRGLSLVAMSAVVWGASIENRGKVVWFEPAAELSDHNTPEPVFDSTVDAQVQRRSDQAVSVTLLGMDVALATELSRQYADLRRELRLLAVAHQEDYPLAANLSEMFASYEHQLPREAQLAVQRARRDGVAAIDLEVKVEPEAGPILTTMLEMFDLADAFCKAERLLSLQRTAEQREFHIWYLTELIQQINGEPPSGFQRAEAAHASPDQQVS
jgi:anti-sigma regulatory factor (Ser/Thr protein kinase)